MTMQPSKGNQPLPADLSVSSFPAIDSISLGIEPDVKRFRDIIKGRVREDLREYITKDDIIAQHGKEIIEIPIREIETPRFTFGSPSEGVGEGEGEGENGPSGKKKAGTGERSGIRKEEFHIEELAQLLGEELKLPRIKPRVTSGMDAIIPRYETISRKGPPSLRDNKRTFREALRRTIGEGGYDEENPVVIPLKEDFRFRASRPRPRPKTNAVIFYMIDVSGSMGDLQKALARNTAFWTDAWIDRQYQGTEKCYIIHDVKANVVDRDTFFTTKEDGGTRISSAYDIAREQIRMRFPPDKWNIYMFHFSDGDNSSEADNSLCARILQEDLLPYINLFGYIQTKSAYGSGSFLPFLEREFANREEVVLASMDDRKDIIPGIKKLLGTGR